MLVLSVIIYCLFVNKQLFMKAFISTVW